MRRFAICGAIIVLLGTLVVVTNMRLWVAIHPSSFREEVRPWELRLPFRPRQLTFEESLGIGLDPRGVPDCGGALDRYLAPSAGPYLVEHFEEIPAGLPPYAAASLRERPQDPRGNVLAVLGMLDTDPRFFEEKTVKRVQEISPPEDAECAYWWIEDHVVLYGLRGLAFRARDGSEGARLILEAMSYPEYWQEKMPSSNTSQNYIWPMLMALAFMDCVRGDVAIMDEEARAAGVRRFASASRERLAMADIEPSKRMESDFYVVLVKVWLECSPDDEWMRRIIRERRESWRELGEHFLSGKLQWMQPVQVLSTDD